MESSLATGSCYGPRMQKQDTSLSHVDPSSPHRMGRAWSKFSCARGRSRKEKNKRCSTYRPRKEKEMRVGKDRSLHVRWAFLAQVLAASSRQQFFLSCSKSGSITKKENNTSAIYLIPRLSTKKLCYRSKNFV